MSVSPGLGPPIQRTAEQVQAIMRAGVPSSAEAGITVDAITPKGAVVSAPFKARNVRPGGTLSGPSMMGLADAAMWVAILARLDDAQMAVTSEMSIRFLRRPPLAGMIARAEIVRFGRRQVVLEVRLFVEGEDAPIALVVGTYALPQTGAPAVSPDR